MLREDRIRTEFIKIKDSEDKTYRLMLLEVGDKLSAVDESDARGLLLELERLGVVGNIGCNESGLWSVAIIEVPEDTWIKIPGIISNNEETKE